MTIAEDLIERFMSFVLPEPNSGCWIWDGGDSGDGRGGGYGRFWAWGTMVAAHRFSYEAFVGKIKSGMTLDHTCGLRCCVNPNHLEQVSNKENCKRRDKRNGG